MDSMKITTRGITLAALVLLGLAAASCDRDRSNPLDPQSDFVQNRPATPGQVAVQPGVGVIQLAWQAVADRDLAGYAVFRAVQSNGTYEFVAGDGDSTVGITTGKTAFSDTIRGTTRTFFYRIAAVDTAGLQSELTSFVGATALEDNVAPDAPQNLSAVPDEDVLGRVVLRWSAPQTDGNGGELSGLAGYVVLRAEAGTGGVVPVDTLAAGEREYVDEGLKTLTSYSYSMVSFDAFNNVSRPATAVQVTTPGLPTPQGITATDDLGRIVISWRGVEDEALIGYDVYRSARSDDGYVRLTGTEGADFTTGRTTYIDSNLAGGSLFYYRVRAVGRDAAASELSAFVSGEAQTDEVAPGSPASVSAVADEAASDRILVRWSAPTTDADGDDLSGLAGFVIFRSEGGTGSFVPADTVAADVREYDDRGLKSLTLYAYTVVAFDAAGNESRPATSSSTRTGGVATPQGLQADDDIGRISISWQPVDDSDLAGYDVYRSTRSDTGYERLVGSEGTEFTTGRTTYVDSNLVGGALFYYKVQAIETTGLRSERSAFVGGRAQADEAAPGSPRNVSAVADENDPGRITVGWSAPSTDADGGDLTGLDGFVLLRAEGAEGALLTVDTLAADVRTYVDTGLKALTAYRYALVAFDASGNQSSQVLSSATRTAGIQTPAQVRAADGLGRITVTWQAVDSEDVVGYDVYRATRSDGTYEVVAGNEGSDFTTGRTTFVDSNLAGGTLLFYRIRAIGGNGLLSELSAFVSGRAEADESAPGSPQNVSVIPSESDPTQITVRWTAPTTDANGGQRTGLAGFRLLRAEGSGSLVPVATLDADVRQYDDTGLRSLTTYRYALIAFDASGNESGQSSAGQASTIGVEVPTGVRAADGIGRIQITWSAVDDDNLIGYNVYRSTRPDQAFTQLAGDGGSAFTTGRTTFIDSTATTGQLLYYKVSAVTSALESEFSAFVSGEAAADDVAPATPGDLVAIADDAQAVVTLSWTGSRLDQDGGDLTGLSSYILFRGKGSSTALAALDTIAASSTSYTDNALQAATTYYYAVSALDGSGNVSPRSATVSATTQGIGAPQSVAATGDITRITVSWAASDEDDLLGYNVYRSSRSDQGYTRLEGTEGTSFTTGQSSYIDSNLAGGQILYYRVTVVTSSGESERSAFRGATVQTDTRSPAAPTFLDGEPVTGDPEKLVLTWRAPSSDSDGSALTGVSLYRVYRSTTSDGDYQEIASVDTLGYADTGLEQRTTYYYQVEALDDDGNVSPRSSTAAATTSGVDIPTNVRLVATTPSDLTQSPTVTISWTRSSGAIVRYEVQRGLVANSTTDSDYTSVLPNNVNTTRDDTDVSRGTTYYYRVRAIDVDGRESDWTEPLGIAVQN